MMPGRIPLSSDERWFRVGNVDVNTTTLVSGLCVFSFFVYAATKESLLKLVLLPGSVRGGQLWRLATWPLVNEPNIWVALTIVIFWMFGSQLENLVGRKRFLIFLVALAIIPALVATALDRPLLGIGMLETGVFLAFAIEFPTAQFFFGIPARILAAIFIGIEALRYLGDDSRMFLVLVATLITSVLFLRAIGLGSDLPQWVPRIPIPGALITTGARGRTGRGRTAKPKSKTSRRKNSNLSVVPPQPGGNPSTAAGAVTPDRQARIDAILDKISAHGMESLTAEEREFLQRGTK